MLTEMKQLNQRRHAAVSHLRTKLLLKSLSSCMQGDT